MSRSPSGISTLEQLLEQTLQTPGEERSATVDADESQSGSLRVALGDLVRDARQRPLHVLLAEDDLLAALIHRFLPGLTGPG